MKFGSIELDDWKSAGDINYQYNRLQYKSHGLCLAWFFEPFDRRRKFWIIKFDSSIPVLKNNPISTKYRVDKYSQDEMIKIINEHLIRLEKLLIFI